MSDGINYHHLRYFHAVAREGSITRASKLLHTSPPSISVQIKQLEQQLGQPLFLREGRGLTLTPVGELVRDYAEQIFVLGTELMDVVRGDHRVRVTRLRVGVADSVPKELAVRLLTPAFTAQDPVRTIVHEASAEQLLAELAIGRHDLVLLDEPPPTIRRLQVFAHALGDAVVGVFGKPDVAKQIRRRFPESLAGSSFVLPLEGNLLRSAFDGYCHAKELRVNIAAEVADSGLAKALARDGRGLLLAPGVLKSTLEKNYALRCIGELDDLRLPYYACTAARRVDDPVVDRILRQGRDLLSH